VLPLAALQCRFIIYPCGESTISLHSHTVSLVQWSTRLLPVMRNPGSIPRGVLMWNQDSPVSLSRYIGDPDVIDHCVLVWGGLHPEPSLGHRADNVIIPLDRTQLFCPGFTLAAGPPSSFTTDIVICWGRALWRAWNLTAFTHSSTGPVVHPFASCHEEHGFNPQGGTDVKLGFSCELVSLHPYCSLTNENLFCTSHSYHEIPKFD
jgi:hypothetical protein